MQSAHPSLLLPVESAASSGPNCDGDPRHRAAARRPVALSARWVVVSEYNYGVAEDSWYFKPNRPTLGTFSAPFLREVAKALRGALSNAASRVDRTLN